MDKLIIFDCGGVLVDDATADKDITITTKNEIEDNKYNFNNMDVNSLKDIVEKKLDMKLPDSFEIELKETSSNKNENIHPIKGIKKVLMNVPASKCVTSNKSSLNIENSLELTNLSDFFDKDSIFSSKMVKRGKPYPDLFLHAAEKMGVEPRDCVVIEDSVAGVKAGRMAGMVVLGFTGGSHKGNDDYRKELEEAGADIIFNDMSMLPRLIGK